MKTSLRDYFYFKIRNYQTKSLINKRREVFGLFIVTFLRIITNNKKKILKSELILVRIRESSQRKFKEWSSLSFY